MARSLCSTQSQFFNKNALVLIKRRYVIITKRVRLTRSQFILKMRNALLLIKTRLIRTSNREERRQFALGTWFTKTKR